jgi:hypothetical protein
MESHYSIRFLCCGAAECFMKFGSWTYDGLMVDLRHMNQVNEQFDQTPINYNLK